MRKSKPRTMMGAVLLAAAVAACERSPLQTEAPALPGAGAVPAPWDLEPGTDTVRIDTGYFGSGHYQPPPSDSMTGDPPG